MPSSSGHFLPSVLDDGVHEIDGRRVSFLGFKSMSCHVWHFVLADKAATEEEVLGLVEGPFGPGRKGLVKAPETDEEAVVSWR